MAFTRANLEQRMRTHFPGEHGKQLTTIIAQLNDDIIALRAWSDALATKLNGEAASGVTNFDTNYVGATAVTTTGI